MRFIFLRYECIPAQDQIRGDRPRGPSGVDTLNTWKLAFFIRTLCTFFYNENSRRTFYVHVLMKQQALKVCGPRALVPLLIQACKPNYRSTFENR